MDYKKLIDYWIEQHNEKYSNYIFEEREPRYDLKNFFLNSYYLFREFGEDWETYIDSYNDLFRRDPSNDYYQYRDPLEKDKERQNALEWTSLFEIIANVGFPHNRSAKENLLKNSTNYLKFAKFRPNSPWVDFMLSSAVANLPECFDFVKNWLPLQISKYIESECSPHQYIAYLNALKNCENQSDLKEKIVTKLVDWIRSPKGTPEAQVIIWARLITRLNWLPEFMETGIKKEIQSNFLKTLDSIYSVSWHYSPMILEAYYVCSDQNKRNDILHSVGNELTPSFFFKLHEIFPFINPSNEAPEVADGILKIKEKCGHPSKENCKLCMETKKDDCWIRIISKLTYTEPRLHSGYEIADTVIYEYHRGTYIVMKADPITRQIGEGDVLFRQCVSLFSKPYALVLYLNPYETAPFVIENIKTAAENSAQNPRFGVINGKYVWQLYAEYKRREEDEKATKEKPSLFDF